MGPGPGMHGRPGDSSSPSRFVRATALVASLRPVAKGDDDDPANDDHTLWSSIANLGQLRYIVRGYDNPIPQLVDLKSTASGDHAAVWRAGRVAHGDPHGYGPGLP